MSRNKENHLYIFLGSHFNFIEKLSTSHTHACVCVLSSCKQLMSFSGDRYIFGWNLSRLFENLITFTVTLLTNRLINWKLLSIQLEILKERKGEWIIIDLVDQRMGQLVITEIQYSARKIESVSFTVHC